MMRAIIGLGNPESRYMKTRHNIGFIVADSLVTELEASKFVKNNACLAETSNGILDSIEILIAKPTTFMNNSGEAVKAIFKKYQNLKVTDLIIVHDDLDISFGDYKIQFGKGPKVHNGVNSIEDMLGTKDFWRVRIGVDARTPKDRISGEEYVLMPFSKEELDTVDLLKYRIAKDILSHVLHK